MPNLIILEEKEVKAKGLNQDNKVNLDKLNNYIFEEDYRNLNLINNIEVHFKNENITLLYPGCGVDILFPLFYLEKLFPKVNETKLIFIDVENCLGTIKTILDDLGISFKENIKIFKKNENEQISFYWNEKLIKLEFIHKNVGLLLDNLPNYNIYFEKAFRIMKDDITDYEDKIFTKLDQNGILISDSGFSNFPLKRIEVSEKLSSYKEMIIGIKQ
jgi:hypothetical protein